MSKTCRTCGADWVYCEVPTRDLSTVRRSGKGCGFWFRHEEPLLVDTLAKALHMVWGRRYTDGDESDITPDYTIRLTDAECEAVKTALARYKEEVGDESL